jgi:hypothetical protein
MAFLRGRPCMMSFINDDTLHSIKGIFGKSFILTERLVRCDGAVSLD